MTKTYLYIPEGLDAQINEVVKVKNISKAEVLRQALSLGLAKFEDQKVNEEELPELLPETINQDKILNLFTMQLELLKQKAK